MPSAITYSKIADGFIDKRIQLDSAAYYLNKADAAPDYNSMAVSGITLFSYGKLYQVKGDYHQALEYYLKSVSALQKTEFRTYTRTAFDSISNTYGYLNNAEKSNEYLKKYKAINDTIKNEEKAAVNIVVNKLLQQEMQEKQKQKKNLYFIFSGFVVLVLIIIYAILRFYRTKQLRKENLLEQQTMENMQLKRQLDGSVDQIIELAKTNSPFFLTRFRETYSDL
nr:tetratricopeptide repeat protein [Elizabethkingia bruuniana]